MRVSGIILGSCDQVKPDQRHLARPVDRIGSPQLPAIVVEFPFLRIIVDADCRLRGAAQVHMVAEREVAEAQLSGDFREDRPQFRLRAGGAHVVDKGTNPFEHAETLRFRTVTRGVPKRRTRVPPSRGRVPGSHSGCVAANGYVRTYRLSRRARPHRYYGRRCHCRAIPPIRGIT
jgi:hypothetical protein